MGDLTSKQWAVILALLTGATKREAAEAAGVHPNRIAEWLRDPTFAATLDQAQRETVERLVRLMLAQGEASIKTIQTVRDDTASPASVRLRAAESLLDKLLKYTELADLERRVAELEDLYRASQ